MGASYPWEDTPYAGPFSKESIRRTPSVDDLFDPLWRLDVQQHQILVQHQSKAAITENAEEFASSQHMKRSNTEPAVFISNRHIEHSNTVSATSASDEDHLTVDEKKHRRMISNRESARRSRLRKQQHLEDLRSQLVEIRGHNSRILQELSIASQQFSRLNQENELLRVHAMDLTHRLQRLHRQAMDYHPDGLHAYGFGNSHLDPPGLAVGSSTSAYSIVTDVLQQEGLIAG